MRGRAMYAVARSIIRAQLAQLTQEDLEVSHGSAWLAYGAWAHHLVRDPRRRRDEET